MANRWSPIVAVGLGVVLLWNLGQVQAQSLNKQEILAAGEQMALDQFAEMNWDFRHRSWVSGALWVGVTDLSKVSDNPSIHQALAGFATSLGVGNVGVGVLEYGTASKPHHADDMAVGQAFLDYSVKTGNTAVLANTLSRAGAASDYILSPEAADKASRVIELDRYEGLTWSWIDALYMAAPLHARLSAETGDPKYLQAMHLEWGRVNDLLYDTEEHLFYRDKSFLNSTTQNGEKVFWSRGNGWVMSALAHTLPYISEDDPFRSRYVTQFQEMSAKLASLQRPDGSWSASLLDYEQVPSLETSGTALNCYAIAWGINNGLLDEETYRPVVEKAWAALLAARMDTGMLGYVQGVGDHPFGVSPDSWTWYGNGAFLSAAAEVYKLASVPEPGALAFVGLGGLILLRRRHSTASR